jgi:hypothetical protein
MINLDIQIISNTENTLIARQHWFNCYKQRRCNYLSKSQNTQNKNKHLNCEIETKIHKYNRYRE